LFLPILYQDPYLIAIDKPSGLLVHPSKIASDRITCMSLLRDQVGQWVYPAHRLDRGTSGVLLFSFDSATAGVIGSRFREREVEKGYLIVVRGWADDEGEIDYAYADEDDDLPRPARTLYRTLARTELPHAVGRYATARYSLILGQPLSGRTHQIRRHMRHINHHVIGDNVYGDGAHNRLFREKFDSRRLLLHAATMTIEHPVTAGRLTIDAPLPAEMRHLLEQMGWGDLG
jgi:tRNA pseudouridine65 synthase